MPPRELGAELAAQHLGVRTRDQYPTPQVETSRHVALPLGHVLNLVKDNDIASARAHDLVQDKKIACSERGQPQVIEMDGHRRFLVLRDPLVKQGRLPATSNTRDNRRELSFGRYVGQDHARHPQPFLPFNSLCVNRGGKFRSFHLISLSR